MYDTIVIGAGPAGLQAALTLGRMHRDVLVLDSGEYRNGTVEHAHNYATHDGRPPEEFRRLAREDLAEYTTVEVREAAVEAVAAGKGSFVVTIGDTVEQGSTVVLATGVRDRLPDIPGLAQAWGKEVAHCPFCHGHELAGRRVALDVQGPHAERLRSMLERIGADLIDVSGTVRGIERVAGGLVLTLDSGNRARRWDVHRTGVRAVGAVRLAAGTGPERFRLHRRRRVPGDLAGRGVRCR